MKIVGEDFSHGHKDFGPYISKILASGAESSIRETMGWTWPMIKQGAQMGVKTRYATYFLDDRFRLPDIGQVAVGSFVNSTYLPTIDTPQNKGFLERWHKKIKTPKYPWPTANSDMAITGRASSSKRSKRPSPLMPTRSSRPGKAWNITAWWANRLCGPATTRS